MNIIDEIQFLIETKNFELTGIGKNLICDYYTNSSILHTKLQVLSKHIKKTIRDNNHAFRYSDLMKMHNFIEKISQKTNTNKSLNKPDEDGNVVSERNNNNNTFNDFLLDDQLFSRQHDCIPKYLIDTFEKPVAIDIYTVFEFPQLPIIAKNFFISLYLMDTFSKEEVF